MELEPVLKKEFMVKYERYEPLIKDSTQIMAAKTCLRKYFYQIVIAHVPTDNPIYFAWGSAYHKFREHLERLYGFGLDRPKKYDLEKAQNAYLGALEIARQYWKKHSKPEPLGSKFDFMTEARLIKSCAVGFKHWQKEKMQGAVEVIAVEQSFNVQLTDGSHTSGRADQIIRWSGKLWGRDFKTTTKDGKFYARGLEPNDQFTRYTLAEGKLAGEFVQGQFIEVLYNDKSTGGKVSEKTGKKSPVNEKGPEIFDFQTSRTPYQIEQFEKGQTVINKILDVCRETDVWPMQEVNCPFCPYHSVCSKGSEGGMMAQLDAYFQIRPWNNTVVGVID